VHSLLLLVLCSGVVFLGLQSCTVHHVNADDELVSERSASCNVVSLLATISELVLPYIHGLVGVALD
jgi:hypothetical protein